LCNIDDNKDDIKSTKIALMGRSERDNLQEIHKGKTKEGYSSSNLVSKGNNDVSKDETNFLCQIELLIQKTMAYKEFLTLEENLFFP